MFGLFGSTRKRKISSRLTRRRNVRFESLEKRFCLAAPTITSFQIDSVDGTYVSVSGCVTDEFPEMTQVDFSGALSGSTMPDSYGNFSYEGNANSLGAITAVATDFEWLQSNPAEVELTSNPPSLQSISISYGYHTNLTISGQVTDEDPGGLMVYISGVVQGTTTTDSNGYFSFETVGQYTGDVHVDVYDVWNLEDHDTVEVTGDSPPSITNYQVSVDGSGYLTVSGTVVDEDPVGLTVMIAFLSDVYYVTTDSYGYFAWYKQLEQGDQGTLDTIVHDWWDLSASVQSYISYS